jgi:transposase
MEGTSEYGQPVLNLLEANAAVCLVNAAHVKQVPGRKADKADARWLANRMRKGALTARFSPPEGQRDRRELTRHRAKVVQERSRDRDRGMGCWTGEQHAGVGISGKVRRSCQRTRRGVK